MLEFEKGSVLVISELSFLHTYCAEYQITLLSRMTSLPNFTFMFCILRIITKDDLLYGLS